MNMARTAVMLAGLTALFLGAGFLMGGEGGMMIALVFALGMNVFAYWNSDKIVLRMYKARPVDAQTAPGLHGIVTQLARRAEMPMPKVYIIDMPQPNAFATGWSRNAALVAVSTGLLEAMEEGAVEAVLAHEVSHAANGDMVTMALVQGVVNTFVIFLSRVVGFLVDRLVFKVQRGHGPAFWIVSLIAEFVFGFIAMMLVMWFSRRREFRADAGGAKLAGRRNMIAALARLQSAHEQPRLPDEMAAFAIHAGRVQALFASHPPLEARIAALQRMA